MCHEFGTTGLRSCKVTISFYDCFVVAFAFTLVSLLPVCFKVRLRLSRADLNGLSDPEAVEERTGKIGHCAP